MSLHFAYEHTYNKSTKFDYNIESFRNIAAWIAYCKLSTITNIPHYLQMSCLLKELPARVMVAVMGLSMSLQVMTVPFSMASGVTVTLRVEVKSNEELEPITTEISVAVNIPRSTASIVAS